MLIVNEPYIIKTNSPRAAEWVQRLKDHKAAQLAEMRRMLAATANEE